MARPPVSRTVDVLLVSLAPDVREISALLASAGHRIVETIVQRRDRPDTRTFVGRGKLGELRVDAYYETVKRRIKKIRDELDAIRRERAMRRSLRKERGYHLVALAGYANAGKSSLLNALTDERVLVDDRMFSTLATTTRSLVGTRKRILLTDTIGFVDGVPFWMVEAFNATLEEILQADLVLLLVDVADAPDEIGRKVRLAARTLFPKVPADSILPILTKADRLSDRDIETRARLLTESEFHRAPLVISAQTRRGLDALRDAIHRTFAYPTEVHLVVAQDAEAGGRLHWLYEHTEVGSALHGPDRIELVVRCPPPDRGALDPFRRLLVARTPEGKTGAGPGLPVLFRV